MKVALETYGCTMNQSDSDILRYLISSQFKLSDVSDAEVVVINSCGVVEYTEKKIIRRIKKLKALGKKVVVAGCLPRISNKTIRNLADSAISPDNLHLINKAIECAINGEKFFWINRNFLEKPIMCKLRLREDQAGMKSGIAIVSISEGCTGKCSFCATRFARGKLRSFSMDSIIKEVEEAVNKGYVEIQLTSQDTGAYGIDKYGVPSLCKLIEKICEIETERKFMVRVGMMNPKHAYEMLNSLINAFDCERVYKFLHIPVQSGDEKILKLMNRQHGIEEYCEVVSAFRKHFKDCMISTDVIVGFPGENEESFYKTFELIRETKPDLVNITRYSPRRGTPASKLKDCPGWIKKERSRVLTKLVNVIKAKKNKKFIGRKVSVIVTKKETEENRKKRSKENMRKIKESLKREMDTKVLSRMYSYRAVVVKGDWDIGDTLKIRIFDSSPTHLIGYFECTNKQNK